MAAIHNTIFTLLGTGQTNMSEVKKTMNALMGSEFVCQAQQWLSSGYYHLSVVSYMNKTQSALISAYKAAIQMKKYDGTSSDVPSGKTAELKYKLSVTAVKSSTITINYTVLKEYITALKTSRNILETHYLNKFSSVISAVNAASYTQTSSSASASASTAISIGISTISNLIDANAAKEEKKKFNAAKESTLSYLKTSKKEAQSMITGLDGMITRIEETMANFQQADKTMKQKTQDLKEKLKLQELEAYRKSGSATKDGLVEYREELKELQDEHKESYDGEESEAINEEIARLNKELSPQLTTAAAVKKAMGNVADQKSSYYIGSGYSGMCCAVAYAIGIYIVTGQVVDMRPYAEKNGWVNSFPYKHVNSYSVGDFQNRIPASEEDTQKALLAIYKNLLNGLPAMIHYIDNNSKDGHWVTVIGIKEDADINHLSMSDFLVINPSGCVQEYCTGVDFYDYKLFTA